MARKKKATKAKETPVVAVEQIIEEVQTPVVAEQIVEETKVEKPKRKPAAKKTKAKEEAKVEVVAEAEVVEEKVSKPKAKAKAKKKVVVVLPVVEIIEDIVPEVQVIEPENVQDYDISIKDKFVLMAEYPYELRYKGIKVYDSKNKGVVRFEGEYVYVNGKKYTYSALRIINK
jgi:hypothetical protein